MTRSETQQLLEAIEAWTDVCVARYGLEAVLALYPCPSQRLYSLLVDAG